MADNSLGAKTGVPVVVPVITEWESWTPTGSWSTNTTYTGRKRRIGSQGYYEVKIATAGAPTSAALTINMPSGEVINTTDELIQYASGILGMGVARDAGVLPYPVSVGYSSTTAVAVFALSRPTTYLVNSDTTTQAVPFTFGASDEIYLRWDVPIVAWAGSASVAYGAGLATTTKAGLYSVGLAPGAISGATIAAGYLGEKITWASAPSDQTFSTIGTTADWTNATITLTAGSWLLVANIAAYCTTGTGLANSSNFTLSITDSGNTIIQNQRKTLYNITPAAAAMTIGSSLAFAATLELSASTTYKIRGVINGNTGAVGQAFNSSNGQSEFFAIRKA